MSEIDSTLVYMNLSDAQNFFELGNAVTNIEIRVQDVYHAQSVAQDIQRQLGFPYLTEDWSRLWISFKGVVGLIKEPGITLELAWKPVDGGASCKLA